MKTPLEYDELPSEEWKKLKQFVVSPSTLQNNSNNIEEFEQNVVTKILVSSLTVVPVPDNFEEEVMRRIAAEAEPTFKPLSNLERIVGLLRTQTTAVIGIVALISGGTISIYTLSQNSTLVAPFKQNIETEIDLTPVPVQIETRFDKQTTQQKTKSSILQPDSIKLPIPGKGTHQPVNNKEEDLF
ncbi:MAG: hypothetical protein JST20_07245 [Bacteroidetes bacterium]|nr:hypothetical protein [Bacteroidota bacterium]